jgi:hypothetical protein
MMEDPRYSSWTNVLQVMLNYCIRLEQESVFENDNIAFSI